MKNLWIIILLIAFILINGGCKSGGGSLSYLDPLDPPGQSGNLNQGSLNSDDPPLDPPNQTPYQPPHSPEPATLLMVGGGIAILGLRKFFKKDKC